MHLKGCLLYFSHHFQVVFCSRRVFCSVTHNCVGNKSPIFFAGFYCLLHLSIPHSKASIEAPVNSEYKELNCRDWCPSHLIGDFAKGTAKRVRGSSGSPAVWSRGLREDSRSILGWTQPTRGYRLMSCQPSQASCPPATHLITSSVSPFFSSVSPFFELAVPTPSLRQGAHPEPLKRCPQSFAGAVCSLDRPAPPDAGRRPGCFPLCIFGILMVTA